MPQQNRMVSQPKWYDSGHAEFVCAMEEVLDVYKRPIDASHPLVCMDEVNTQLLPRRALTFVCRARSAATAGL